jgi:hypothetical protein
MFTGSGVYIFGALRINHGGFNVTVDGVTTTGMSFGNPFVFQALLFGQGNLPYGKHEVVFTNAFGTGTAPLFVDLDFVVITTGDGDDRYVMKKRRINQKLTRLSVLYRTIPLSKIAI